MGEATARAEDELRSGRDAVVHAVGPLPAGPRPVSLVVERLGRLALSVVERAGPRGLIVGGGATASAVLHALGAQAVDVDDEPLPGIGAGVIVGGRLSGRPVVFKAGAAGDEGAVANLLRYLRRRANESEQGE